MSTTTTTTTRDRGDRYGPMEWAQIASIEDRGQTDHEDSSPWPLTFNPSRAMVMSDPHIMQMSRLNVTWFKTSNVRIETNGLTNGQSQAIALAAMLTLSVMMLLKRISNGDSGRSVNWYVHMYAPATYVNSGDTSETRLPLAADPLITAAHNRSTVFARWCPCARPSNTRFIGPTNLSSQTASRSV